MEAEPDEATAMDVLRRMVAAGNLLWQGGPGVTWVAMETDWVDVGPAGAALLRRLADDAGRST